MSVELLLSTRILLVLNLSIISIITKGSSCSYFKGGILWMLFTYLWYDFLRDLNDPLVDGSPVTVFISPIALCWWCGLWLSFLGEASGLSLPSSLGLLESPFFTNFCSFPFVWVPLFSPSSLYSPLCSGRDLYENGSISSCHGHWVTSVVALATWGSARP